MQNETLRRNFAVEGMRDAKGGDVIEFTFSSENPVSVREGFDEILDHSPEHADFSRLNNHHPFLLGHDVEKVLGVVEKAWIENRRGKARVRFSRSAFAQEIKQDILDGVRRNVSVGFLRTKELSRQEVGGREVRRYAWRALECSSVPIPADATVGIGRSNQTPINHRTEITVMNNTYDNASPEAKRVMDLNAIKNNMASRVPGAAEYIDNCITRGVSVAECQDTLMTMLPAVNPVGRALVDVPEKLRNRYSISGAIMKQFDALHGKCKFDGLERELSDECIHQSRITPKGFFIPTQILTRANNTVGTATMGGNLVGTNLDAGSYIEILRNRAWVAKLGARMLDGLVGNVVIPRQIAAATAYWEGEEVSTTQSNTGFDQITLTPKACTGFEVFSRQLMIQSTPSCDALIRDDLLNVLALALDKACLVDEGTSQGPTAIYNTTGISTVTCAASGEIPSYSKCVEMETALAASNADGGSVSFLTNSALRGALKTQLKTTISAGAGYVWENDAASGEGRIAGLRAVCSNQIPSNSTYGTLTANCSAMYLANWNDLLIGGWGGGIDILVDNLTGAATRVIKVYATQYSDIALRRPESFVYMPNALTS